MIIYSLLKSDGKEIISGSEVEVMRELFKIAEGNGLLQVRHNSEYNATEFEFEGLYCNFTILLRP